MAALMAWQPEAEPLKQLVGYLKDALSAHDQEAQRNATQASAESCSNVVLPFSTEIY